MKIDTTEIYTSFDDLACHSRSQLYAKAKIHVLMLGKFLIGFGLNVVCCHNLLVC